MAYANEHEQWDAIKAWWKVNGKLLISMILLALLLSFSWQFWQRHRTQYAENASNLYDQLVANYAISQWNVFSNIAQELKNNYTSSPYASLAALYSAKRAVAQNDLPLALQNLQWVIAHGKTPALRQIARIRAARVLVAQQQPDAALSLLTTVDDASYQPAIERVKGNIYSAQGNLAAARTAYKAALISIPPLDPVGANLQTDLEQLPVN